LREAAEAAAEAEREARRAREEILSVVSHDLRSPLGAILMGASTLMNIDDARQARTTASRIHHQAERMVRQIDDLVDFASIQAGRIVLHRELHTAAQILDAIADLFGPLASEKGLRLVALSQPTMLSIDCDAERVIQALSNLVANALKVTPRGGEITIGADRRGREAVFAVRDTGPGIDPSDLPRLFERFWRGGSSQYKGAGLGLSIARGIADAHGGRIWVESQLGTGSTFFFALALPDGSG
jgi:signal transduction histidine kinase